MLPSTYRVLINSLNLINMKVTNLDERIHVLDSESNVTTVIKNIAMSGLQEEAFYVLDVGDIVQKHQIWKEKLPRVEPYYGKLFIYLRFYIVICNGSLYTSFSIPAVKCNDNLIVIEVLAALGVNFDCASKVNI